MQWLETLTQLVQSGIPVVMVTVAQVRGHAPREAGTRMLITAQTTWGTIGGGNLEQVCVRLARQLLIQGGQTRLETLRLTEQGSGQHGVQCCGGEVTVLLEALNPTRPCVALFGVGHVGLALAQILAPLPIELWLIDSRSEMLEEARLHGILGNEARVRIETTPLYEEVVGRLPAGSHLLILTHDHAEDLFILEMALRWGQHGYLGLIGSRVKWLNFQQKLLEAGYTPQQLDRVTSPIGLPGLKGKQPQIIAIATAAQLLPLLGLDPPD